MHADAKKLVGRHTGITLFVPDLLHYCGDLHARGVRFVTEPTQQPWGIMAMIADPDGNILALWEDRSPEGGAARRSARPTARPEAGVSAGARSRWRSRSSAPDTGWVAGADGVRLYYEKIGTGPRTVIVPGRLFLARDLAPLGDRHTLILYDMRNRGRSSRVEDGSLLTIQKDVEDLEAVRRHFRVERFVPVGYSYLGFMVVLYAMDHPDRVERLVQLGPVPRKFGTEYPASLDTPMRCRR